MKSEDRFDNMSPDELDNKKKWFFKESLRLEEMKKELEDERKLIDIQKNLLERQQSKNMLLRKQLENQKIFLKFLLKNRMSYMYLVQMIGKDIHRDLLMPLIFYLKGDDFRL